MASSQSFYTYLATISLLFHLFHFSSIEAQNDGFTVKLIQKTSPRYPSYHMGSSNNIANVVQAPISAYIGQYLMELYIGTPPIKILAEVDTGSDLIWVQCVPCFGCYKQINPMFNPLKSSTYNNISCNSSSCQQLYTHECSPEKHCNYTYSYGDNSVTNGVLAQETITLTSSTRKSVSLQKIIFGCGHNDKGNFNDHEMGIIGLGKGPLSLISQLGPFVGGKKFSQCLVPFHTDIKISSKMSFGKGSEVIGDGVVTTPMVNLEQDITAYYVTLLGISVEDKYLPFDSSSKNIVKGNILIDSGTPPTYLPKNLYDRVANEVRNRVPLKPISDDPSIGTQLCYHTKTNLFFLRYTKTNLKGPKLTFHFEGAKVVLSPIQIFIPPKDGVFCLALTPTTTNEPSIYGNFAQSNYLIGFDLERQLVSFKPTDCIKHS